MRKLLAALAVALTVPAAGPAHADVLTEDAGVYVVPAGVSVTTLLPTQAGSTYQVVVTGVATYGDGFGMLDCGYWSAANGSNLLGLWYAQGNFRINGASQDCGSYNTAHTYTMLRTGDGGHWTFDFCECNGWDGDNAGALVVTLQRL